MEERDLILRTYGSVWKIDRKIYSIEGAKLPFPVSFFDFIYFIFSFLFVVMLSRVIPILGSFHIVIKYVALPMVLTKALTSIKLDGKYPHKFLIGYISFLLAGKNFSKFRAVTLDNKVQLCGDTVFREYKIIDKTKEILKN